MKIFNKIAYSIFSKLSSRLMNLSEILSDYSWRFIEHKPLSAEQRHVINLAINVLKHNTEFRHELNRGFKNETNNTGEKTITIKCPEGYNLKTTGPA